MLHSKLPIFFVGKNNKTKFAQRASSLVNGNLPFLVCCDFMFFSPLLALFLASAAMEKAWGSLFLILLLLCSRYTLHGNCGWNQDSDQAGETHTWGGVPCQHHCHEGLWGKWTCLRVVHHRWVGGVVCLCVCVTVFQRSLVHPMSFFTFNLVTHDSAAGKKGGFYLWDPSGKWTGFGMPETSLLAHPSLWWAG